ncbi:YcnI family protein [Paenibacillus aurantius]|uniref:YcnI family protein n=1 Tax=Paenibacillus aurantius TaxID=2918900 RepID=A0AA96RH64_9BACL|nr:YcnI family protein [Paenibacillus aurantius]WNQ13033.1 YcnI family protein [Paenibacillus aurantius]
MKKWTVYVSAIVLGLTLFSGLASAHVTVMPKESVQGAYEKFTVRVPTESDSPTVKVEVRIPPEAEISRVEPKPGWKVEFVKDASGKNTSMIWTAEGPGLSKTEFAEFNMQGKVGDTATSLSWKAYQTAADGSKVEWVGAPDSDKPASVTIVKAKPAGAATDSHGAADSSHSMEPAQDNAKLPLYLSIAAVVLGALSLLVSLSKRKA